MKLTRKRRSPIGGSTRNGQIAALMVLVWALILGGVIHSGAAKTSTTLISIGESNTDAQKAELMGYFGNPKDAQVTTVTVADTQDAMAGLIDNTTIGTAYSSAALTCLPLGDGLNVSTINITSMTPAIYAIALVTAGVGDANLIVAAPSDAPAGGLTALAGIFQSWDKVNCESSQTTPERQELALREIALTAQISAAAGQSTGYAGAFVIDAQRAIVVGNYTSADDISAAIANQEAIYGFTVPTDLRADLVDFFVDLQKQNIDWSTFSAGWTIEYPTANQIIMKGDGIAIKNAQASATANAAKDMTATAKARKNKTATARAEAHGTQTAIAALNMTQTAVAMPTATATPTPLPNDASGTLTGPIDNNQVSLTDASGQNQTLPLAANATLVRDGKTVTADAFQKGDTVALKVDAVTNEVVSIDATPAPSKGTPIAKLALLLPLLLLIPLGMIVRGRSYGDPFVVKRVVRE